jgi:hypothetical protein
MLFWMLDFLVVRRSGHPGLTTAAFKVGAQLKACSQSGLLQSS